MDVCSALITSQSLGKPCNVVLGGTLGQAIALVVGGVLALFGVVGGVSAYQGSPSGVAPENLYSYADA